METLAEFASRFSLAVGCYCKRNKTNYSLKKHASDIRGRMGVFAWIAEKTSRDLFQVSTYEYLADEQGILDADHKKIGAHFVPKNKDQGQGTGLYYSIRRGSSGKDFQEAVRALKVISRNKQG